jgi:excisionase family DNA binding protein
VEDKLLHREEAAEYLRTPVATLAQWAYRGVGPEFFRTGRRVLYRKSDLDRWLDAQRVVPGAS